LWFVLSCLWALFMLVMWMSMPDPEPGDGRRILFIATAPFLIGPLVTVGFRYIRHGPE